MSRIALLTHSTNPRGGVVHALELGEALTTLGHDVTVHAPDPTGGGFFRATACRTVAFAAAPTATDLSSMVARRIEDYVAYFTNPAYRAFDIFHAQDSISGNALATLKSQRLIPGFYRSVHHLDEFADPRLAALQLRAVTAADRHFVVSRMWQARLRAQFGFTATIVGNGVDAGRFATVPDGAVAALRQRLGLGGGPVILSIGGIEPRKNSRRLLTAFRQLLTAHPTAQLLVAGGAALLDHRAYQAEFAADLAAADLPPAAVVRTGPLPQPDMPALYRCADLLAFPSLLEGFGLVVLEAMASGLPTVVSRIAPFTEYLGEADAAWCDPMDAVSIASAMADALHPGRRNNLIRNGKAVAVRHDWARVARAHLPAYAESAEAVFA